MAYSSFYNIGDLVEIRVKYFYDDDGLDEDTTFYRWFHGDTGIILSVEKYSYYNVYWQKACKYQNMHAMYIKPLEINK